MALASPFNPGFCRRQRCFQLALAQVQDALYHGQCGAGRVQAFHPRNQVLVFVFQPQGCQCPDFSQLKDDIAGVSFLRLPQPVQRIGELALGKLHLRQGRVIQRKALIHLDQLLQPGLGFLETPQSAQYPDHLRLHAIGQRVQLRSLFRGKKRLVRAVRVRCQVRGIAYPGIGQPRA